MHLVWPVQNIWAEVIDGSAEAQKASLTAALTIAQTFTCQIRCKILLLFILHSNSGSYWNENHNCHFRHTCNPLYSTICNKLQVGNQWMLQHKQVRHVERCIVVSLFPRPSHSRAISVASQHLHETGEHMTQSKVSFQINRCRDSWAQCKRPRCNPQLVLVLPVRGRDIKKERKKKG